MKQLFSVIAIVVIFPYVLFSSPQNGYTSQKMRTLAYNYKKVRENRLSLSIEDNPFPFFMYYEFKGYVLGVLDSDKRLKECRQSNSHTDIVYKTSLIILSTKLDESIPSTTTSLVAIHFACDNSTKWNK